jgi:hypothetical protein
MKKLLLSLLALSSILTQAQVTTVFSENVGSPTGTTTYALYTGWQNNGTLTFTGTGDVRSTTASTNAYTGASGTGNVFLTTNATLKTLVIGNINTLGYTSLNLAFGLFKSTTASNGSELSVEVSTDGVAYTALTLPALPTGSGTASWKWVKATGAIPAAANLRIRFTNTATTGPQFRLDDIKLTDGLSPDSITTTPSTYGAPFCAGTAIKVPFSILGIYNSNNIFTAQLSDATGSFASPISIGTLSGLAGDTINATIPINTAGGSGYKIRVVASSPVVIGTDNGTGFTVNAAAISTLFDTICANSSIVFNGQTITTAGIYKDTLTSVTGCDSLVTLNLALKATSSSNIADSICPRGSYLFNGQTLIQAGTYKDTLTAANGCDSVITLTLTLKSVAASTKTASICPGSTYTFGSKTLSQAGTYKDTLTAANGCDSIVTLTLSLKPVASSTQTASICPGSTFSFGGQNLSQAGTYKDTLTAANGCDSIITLTLTLKTIATKAIAAAICPGSSYTFGGQNLTTPGSYKDTLTGVNSCDSIVTLTLSLKTVATKAISASICPGSSLDFGGNNLTTAGTYKDTLTGVNGCDSIVTLTLSLKAVTSGSVSASICPGSSYDFGGKNLTAAGTYKDTVTGSNGCDSIVTLTLSLKSTTGSTKSASICPGFTYAFGGKLLSQAGTYKDTLTGVNGCDSIVTLTLSLKTVVTANVFDSICSGQTYNFNGKNLTVAGVYNDTISSSQGCDSIIHLTLAVVTVSTPVISKNGAVLSTSSYSSYKWYRNGVAVSGGIAQQLTITQNGGYTVVVTGAHGCKDSSQVYNVTGVGIYETNALSSLNVYPNPATQQFTISMEENNANPIHVNIVDVLGKTQKQISFKGNLLTVDVADLTAGIYLVQITSETQTKTIRLELAK